MIRKTLLLLTLCAFAAFGQASSVATAPAAATAPTTISNLIGGGVSFQPGGSPSAAGTGIYARVLTPTTWAFTVMDALPASKTPFTVSLNSSVGVAYSPFSIGRAQVFIPTAAGVAFNGTNTGWNWSTGLMGVINVDSSGLRIMPAVRILKSSVTGAGSTYGFIVGAYLGWGF